MNTSLQCICRFSRYALQLIQMLSIVYVNEHTLFVAIRHFMYSCRALRATPTIFFVANALTYS